MTKEEYLSQVQVLSRRIDYHRERLYRLRRDADAVSSRWGESAGARSADAPYVRMLEKIESAGEQLASENDLLSRLQEQVENAIGALPEERMRLVLLYHYLEGLSYSQIGAQLYLDKGTVYRWKERAVGRLELPEDPISIS